MKQGKIDYRLSKEGRRRFAHPWIYRATVVWQKLLGRFGYSWHNSFSDECCLDFSCCVLMEGEISPPPGHGVYGSEAMRLSAGSSSFLIPEVDLYFPPPRTPDPRGVPIMLPDVKSGDTIPSTTWETWMNEARQMAESYWLNSSTPYGSDQFRLREEVARAIANWMDCAAQAYRDVEFYRGIVVQIGTPFGVAARTSDDGSVQQDVLALKVPELVRELRGNAARWALASVCSERLYLCLRGNQPIPDDMKTTGLGGEVQHLLTALEHYRKPKENL